MASRMPAHTSPPPEMENWLENADPRTVERAAKIRNLMRQLGEELQTLERGKGVAREEPEEEVQSRRRDSRGKKRVLEEEYRERSVEVESDFQRRREVDQKQGSVFERLGDYPKAGHNRTTHIHGHHTQTRETHDQTHARSGWARSRVSSRAEEEATEIQALKKRLAELERKEEEAEDAQIPRRPSPFVRTILAEPTPNKFKVPQVGLYDGVTDPTSHLYKYMAWMELQGASEAMMCKAFPLTLGDRGQRWFRMLERNSISSWDQLSEQFSAHFMGVKDRMAPKERLVTIKQAKDEKLKKYLERFNNLAMEMEKISDDAMLMAVMAGLWPRSHF